MFLAPSRYNLGESLLITTLLGIPLGEPDGKTPTAGSHRGASRQRSTEESDGILRIQLPGDRCRNHLRFLLVGLHRQRFRRIFKSPDRPRVHGNTPTRTTRRNHFRQNPSSWDRKGNRELVLVGPDSNSFSFRTEEFSHVVLRTLPPKGPHLDSDTSRDPARQRKPATTQPPLSHLQKECDCSSSVRSSSAWTAKPAA